MLQRTSAVLLGLLLTGTAIAAESADIEDAVRELHQSAKTGSDLWLCLQLEAYAAGIGLRLPAVLGRSTVVHGQPLLSYPDHILTHVDRGEYCLVVAGNRVQRVAPDGRPLDRGNWLPFQAERAALSPGGRFLAVARLDGPETQRTVRIAVLDFKRGNRAVINQSLNLGAAVPPAEDELDGIAVADDGSAAAVVIERDNIEPEPHNAVVATAKATTTVPNIREIDVLGPGGAWMVARTPDDRDGLYVGAKLTAPARVGHDRSAGGAGIAVMRLPEGYGVQLVAADGSVTPWTPTGVPGDVREVFGIGEWLALRCSGSVEATPLTQAADVGGGSADLFAAQSAPEPAAAEADGAVDLFAAPEAAAPAPSGDEDPQATLLYRWADLAKDPAAAPAYQLNGACRTAHGHAMSLLLWRGTQLDLIALDGEVPRRSGFASAPDAIDDAWFSEHHYVVAMRDGTQVIVDQHGVEIGRFPHQEDIRTDVRSLGTALRYRYDENGELVEPVIAVLSPDPAQRREVALAAWPEGLRAGHAHVADDASVIVVARNQQWMRFDPRSGAVIGAQVPDGSAPRPQVLRVNHSSGRFRIGPHWTHLLPVDAAADDPDRPRWAVADATLVGRTLLVLDRDGAVHAPGRRGWQEFARLPGAERFVTVRGDKGIFLGFDHRNADAELRPGRGLEPIDPPHDADEPDHGSWQVRGTLFTVPGKAKQQHWNARASRFRPQRLQGVGRTALLAICPSVVLQLDASTAAALGADFDREERRRASRDRVRDSVERRGAQRR